ncbi:MAG: hypothetical protein WCL71_05620 [Deltaproteobacteria bacterium]
MFEKYCDTGYRKAIEGIEQKTLVHGDKTRSFAAAVDADWQRSRDMRITAVPTHLFEGKRLAGFAPYDDFVHLIEKR